MLQHLILAVCQIVIAFIMLGALIVFIFAVREASLNLHEWLKTVVRRHRKYKLDRRQSRQHERLRDGNRPS